MKLRPRFARSLATAASLALAGCTAVGAAPLDMPALAATPAPAPAATPSGPALWKVADEDTTIYLFGTVHFLPETADWFVPRVASALAASGSLVTELPADALTDPRSQQVIARLAMLPEGKNLRDMLSAGQRTAYEAALAKLKMPPQAFDRLEPWFAGLTLSVIPLIQSGYKTDSGVEKVLESKAGTIDRGAVETLEGQLSLFDDLPQDAQVAFLMSTVDNLDKLVPQLDEMVAAWSVGDAEKLAVLMNDSLKDDPTLAERLLYGRNRNWAAWIDDRLDRPGTVFLAVGAGHLAGAQSVQDALARRGIESVRIK